MGAGETVGLRAPWQRGAWSRNEVARFLQARRGELRRRLAARRDARGVPAGLLDEVVDEAVCSVTMMRREVRCEEHALGAFWMTVGFLLRRVREGRYALRVGASKPIALDEALARPAGDRADLGELVESQDEAARAADWLVGLAEVERQVLGAMAANDAGPARVAQILGLDVGAVRAAARSARLKLDQVEAVAAAGRMCSYRRPAILACIQGTADAGQRRAAGAHVRACVACRREYAADLRRATGRSWPSRGFACVLPGWGWLARLRSRGAGGLAKLAARMLVHTGGVAGVGGGISGVLPVYVAMTLATATVTPPGTVAPDRARPEPRTAATVPGAPAAAPSTVRPHARKASHPALGHRRARQRGWSGERAHVRVVPVVSPVVRTVAPRPSSAAGERAAVSAEFGFEESQPARR